jgi:hypothetical protein
MSRRSGKAIHEGIHERIHGRFEGIRLVAGSGRRELPAAGEKAGSAPTYAAWVYRWL